MYSYGLLCLWLFLQNSEVEEISEHLRPLLFTKDAYWNIDCLENLKSSGTLLSVLLLELQKVTSSNPIVAEFATIFEAALQLIPQTRASDITALQSQSSIDIHEISLDEGMFRISVSDIRVNPIQTYSEEMLRTHCHCTYASM